MATDGLNTISYLYGASGAKLRKHVMHERMVEHTVDYCGSFVYEDGQLQYLLTSEGRVVFNPDDTHDYQYFLKDHLGNTRVTFGEDGIIQEDSYYPFGMTMAGLSDATGTDLPNKYLYNAEKPEISDFIVFRASSKNHKKQSFFIFRDGKELQDDYRLDWYDYGARFSDPVIGRWYVVDSVAEKYSDLSPYDYVANNPLKFIDPDGKRIFAVGAISKYYVKSYLKEHFSNSKTFKVTNIGEIKINQRKFNKQYKNASSDQRILMGGLKEAINRKEVAQIHVNQTSDNFELTKPILGTDIEYFRIITSDKAGGTIPPDGKLSDYYVLINTKRANNDELNATDGSKTGKSASSTFFHEVLDEFLNYYTKKTVDDNSSQADKVQYQNAALRNIDKKERDGSDHQ